MALPPLMTSYTETAVIIKSAAKDEESKENHVYPWMNSNNQIHASPAVFATNKAFNAGILFLQNGGFSILPEDYTKRIGKGGYTICQAQGTPGLRKAARLISKEYCHLFHPKILRKIGRFHEKNFRILQLKRLGHALSLKGTVKFKDGTFTQYTGFSEAFSIPMVASSVRSYSKKKSSLISEKTGKWIAKTLISNSSSDIHFPEEGAKLAERIKDRNYLKPIPISSGYDWHSTQIFFFRGFLIYCNRGAGSESTPGVAVYRIPDLNRITPELINLLIQRHKLTFAQWKQYFSLPALIETLGLKFVYWMPQKKQKTGNCTYVSAKSGARALLAIRYLMNKFKDSETPISPLDWEEAFSKTTRAYKDWNYYDKNLVIQDLLKDGVSFNNNSGLIRKEQYQQTFQEIWLKILQKPARYISVQMQFSRIFETLFE